MRPANLKTKIFLDGGDPGESKDIIKVLGFLDGQTTNPTLISKNPAARQKLKEGKRFSEKEVYAFYRDVVGEISALIPEGSVSIEVYADNSTSTERMLSQSEEMFGWIPNAHIKFPTTAVGLTAAEQATRKGLRVNMTLCFRQEQAAAVYGATAGASRGDVFVSPFVGRLDDRGENGMDLVGNIMKMFKEGDGHVEVLTASVRTIDHFLYALRLGSDIITAPYTILKEWAERGMQVPGDDYVYDAGGLRGIPYVPVGLGKDWPNYEISHELTDKGIKRFSDDWNSLIG